MAGFWQKVLAVARVGAMVSGRVPIKGVPIEQIAEEAEKDGAAIVASTRRLKAVRKPSPPRSSPGD